MENTVILGQEEKLAFEGEENSFESQMIEKIPKDRQRMPEYSSLEGQLMEASQLIDNVILKKYLHNLTELEIFPLEDNLKRISDIRLFQITEMVYQKDEYSTYKFASVFHAVQNLKCGIFIIVDSDGHKTDFYMGVRSLDDKRTTKSLKDTLRNALIGQFPGVKTVDLLDIQAQEFLSEIPSKNIASVSCVANNKDETFNDNETFIQGLEKLALAMQGKRYTAIVLAKSTPAEQIDEIRHGYETIYTQLSPFANMQLSYGTNTALSVSNAFSHGTTSGTSYSKNWSTTLSTSTSTGYSANQSVSKASPFGTIVKAVGTLAIGALGVLAAPVTAGASVAIAGATLAAGTATAVGTSAVAIGAGAATAGAIAVGQAGLNAIRPSEHSKGTSVSENKSESKSKSEGETTGTNESQSETKTDTQGWTSGTSDTMQLSMQNKTLLNTMERIEQQLKRMDECESLGMWECAAYFLSDSQETAEMAANTYKALMKGTKSGVETSAVNVWGRQHTGKLQILRDYVTNFIHPVFCYYSGNMTLPVTASSLVSSNELAIQMGLPRKSVCGFPVIEHAEFGKEVVSYEQKRNTKSLYLGNIFSMGTQMNTQVHLDSNSLTMHTFVTGSTGSGKSNTIYEILNQLHQIYNVPFLVVEPAKGEYKHVFGQYTDVSVYGTNPQKTELLRINPFRFPEEIHVLEHMDRLVEIFNVCWPMYAAMPAILKEAMERAYVTVGWDLVTSENERGQKFPNFIDLLEQIECVINESKYSADSKGDYSGALLTRVRSLTTGLNGLLFSNEDITDAELFDKSVIIDLSRVGSTETKSLIMGILVMKLNEYRMCSGKMNSPLSHITVLEEAHTLLRRTSTEQSSESSNLLGKSVELLANSIAEMRTYGEGFIIADQSPGLLDMSVIRNTNTKIVLRLPDKGDRELVGYAAGLKEEQIDELSKLKRGVAVVYQNDWVEPVLVQVNKCELSEVIYDFDGTVTSSNIEKIKTQIINFLIQGRLQEKLDFSTQEIESELETIELSSFNREFIEEQIMEYKEAKTLEIWEDANFRRLSRCVTEIAGVREKVEHCVLSAIDDAELTRKLEKIACQVSPNASKSQILVLSQCFMKDMSTRPSPSPEEEETRRGIYIKWITYMRGGV